MKLTWDVVLVCGPVPAAEAGDAAGDHDHKHDGHAANDQQQLQVDLEIRIVLKESAVGTPMNKCGLV